jgi:hypothetical protein
LGFVPPVIARLNPNGTAHNFFGFRFQVPAFDGWSDQVERIAACGAILDWNLVDEVNLTVDLSGFVNVPGLSNPYGVHNFLRRIGSRHDVNVGVHRHVGCVWGSSFPGPVRSNPKAGALAQCFAQPNNEANERRAYNCRTHAHDNFCPMRMVVKELVDLG